MQQGNESSTQRAVEIQIRADGESQSYSSRILQIDPEKAMLLSPMDETEVVSIRSGSEVILNFADVNGIVSETYRTIALDQIWGEEQEAWILTVTQPEEGKIRLRQYARHEEILQVNVQLLPQKQAFRA